MGENHAVSLQQQGFQGPQMELAGSAFTVRHKSVLTVPHFTQYGTISSECKMSDEETILCQCSSRLCDSIGRLCSHSIRHSVCLKRAYAHMYMGTLANSLNPV